jgi:hypothetical protein
MNSPSQTAADVKLERSQAAGLRLMTAESRERPVVLLRVPELVPVLPDADPTTSEIESAYEAPRFLKVPFFKLSRQTTIVAVGALAALSLCALFVNGRGRGKPSEPELPPVWNTAADGAPLYEAPAYEPTAAGTDAISAATPTLAPLPVNDPTLAEPLMVEAAESSPTTEPMSEMVLEAPISNAPYPEAAKAPTSEVTDAPAVPAEMSTAANDDAFVRDQIPVMEATPPAEEFHAVPVTTTAARPVPNWQQPAATLPNAIMNQAPGDGWSATQAPQGPLPTMPQPTTNWQTPSTTVAPQQQVQPGGTGVAGQHGFYRMDQPVPGVYQAPQAHPAVQAAQPQMGWPNAPTTAPAGNPPQTPGFAPQQGYGPTTRAPELQLNPQANRGWPPHQVQTNQPGQVAAAPQWNGAPAYSPQNQAMRVAQQPNWQRGPAGQPMGQPAGPMTPAYTPRPYGAMGQPNTGVNAMPNPGAPHAASPSAARLAPQIQPLTGTTR